MVSPSFISDYQLLKRYWSLAVRLSSGRLDGLFQSGFKGSGLEWQELRPLAEGDDARLIDWKATAKSGRPHIRLFEEERDLRLLLLVDFSPNMLADCGRAGHPKATMLLNLAFMLGYLAINSGDQVGWLLGGREAAFLPFSRDVSRLWQVHQQLAGQMEKNEGFRPSLTLLDLLPACAQKCPREATVIILSDYCALEGERLASLARALAILKESKNIISLKINDPVEKELPVAGLLWLTDPLSGMTNLLDSGNPDFRQEWTAAFHDQEVQLRQIFARLGIKHGQFWTDKEPVSDLITLLAGKNAKKN